MSVLLEELHRARAEEHDRFRLVEQKAMALLAAAGALAVTAAQALVPPRLRDLAGPWALLANAVTLAALVASGVAFVQGLSALRPREFRRLRPRDFTSDVAAMLVPVEVRRSLMERYVEEIETHTNRTDDKLRAFGKGLRAIGWALALLTASLIVAALGAPVE